MQNGENRIVPWLGFCSLKICWRVGNAEYVSSITAVLLTVDKQVFSHFCKVRSLN